MESKRITLAIHTLDKALVLKQSLEEYGIESYFENVNTSQSDNSCSVGIRIKVKEEDISKALTIIERKGLFSYSDEQTYKIDDGRKRILVAVDFSAYSINACRAAFHIAKKINAKVKILHVYFNVRFPSTFPFANLGEEPDKSSVLDKTRKRMLALCNEIDQMISDGELPSINYSYSLREGIVEEEIDNFIQEYKPILLVLGAKGSNNNSSQPLGNVTADIIEMTDIPILVVPESSLIDEALKSQRHIAFLTNMQQSDMKSFDTLSSIVNLYDNVKVTLVHINAINRSGQKWTEKQLAGMKEYVIKHFQGLSVEYKLIDSPDLLKAIYDFIEEEKVNIVSLNTRRRNILGRMFVPSISRKILLGSNVALLVLRGAKQKI